MSTNLEMSFISGREINSSAELLSAGTRAADRRERRVCERGPVYVRRFERIPGCVPILCGKRGDGGGFSGARTSADKCRRKLCYGIFQQLRYAGTFYKAAKARNPQFFTRNVQQNGFCRRFRTRSNVEGFGARDRLTRIKWKKRHRHNADRLIKEP